MDYTHDHLLMIASLAIAFMAGFTGFTILSGISKQEEVTRKRTVAKAAVILGGGIWSMHFVAMLGVRMSVEYFYDPVITLLSAMVAILVVGLALLLLHFWQRTGVTITVAGLMVGVGILAMHYLGMSGMRGATASYSPYGIALAIITSLCLNVAVLWMAYGRRTDLNMFLGTVFFGLSVFTVHFVAMIGTTFQRDNTSLQSGLILSNTALALFVSVGGFLICGGFLLSGVSFLSSRGKVLKSSGLNKINELSAGISSETGSQISSLTRTRSKGLPTEQFGLNDVSDNLVVAENYNTRVPFESNGRTYFVYPREIASVRAEGHYTFLYVQNKKLFCPWSISEFQKKVPCNLLVQVHRSYLINPVFVSSFERTKDNGICHLEGVQGLDRVPVSRSRVPVVREFLGLN